MEPAENYRVKEYQKKTDKNHMTIMHLNVLLGLLLAPALELLAGVLLGRQPDHLDGREVAQQDPPEQAIVFGVLNILEDRLFKTYRLPTHDTITM